MFNTDPQVQHLTIPVTTNAGFILVICEITFSEWMDSEFRQWVTCRMCEAQVLQMKIVAAYLCLLIYIHHRQNNCPYLSTIQIV